MCSLRRFNIAAKRKSGVVALSAHASYQAETLHQHDSNWHAAGRVSELARGTVPCVDGHVSEIVTASERDRGTQHQLGGYMYVRCDVSMACGKVPPECTCILVVLSPTR